MYFSEHSSERLHGTIIARTPALTHVFGKCFCISVLDVAVVPEEAQRAKHCQKHLC